MTQQPPQNVLELMKQYLATMDITEYDKAVPHMLVELFYRHVTEVLEKAKKTAAKRSKTQIEEDDLRIGIKLVSENTTSFPFSTESFRSSSDSVNRNVMPSIPDVPEIILHNERSSLLEANYHVGTN